MQGDYCCPLTAEVHCEVPGTTDQHPQTCRAGLRSVCTYAHAHTYVYTVIFSLYAALPLLTPWSVQWSPPQALPITHCSRTAAEALWAPTSPDQCVSSLGTSLPMQGISLICNTSFPSRYPAVSATTGVCVLTHGEPPVPQNVTVFEDRAFRHRVTLKWGPQGGPSPVWLRFLSEEVIRTQACAGRPCEGRGEGGTCRPGGGPRGTSPAGTLSQTSSLQTGTK